MQSWDWVRRHLDSRFHALVALYVLAGMLAAWSASLLYPDQEIRNVVLLTTIIVSSLPLCFELVYQLTQRNFGVDILAFLAILGAVLLHQYWVAAIVILMLSGGKALEEYATRRASSVLRALAKRMPQIAHRTAADNSTSDIPIDQVAPGDLLAVYPHELCPVDGVVVNGWGSMDESYLTGEPFLIEKEPGAEGR